jgi:hypothetical protein
MRRPFLKIDRREKTCKPLSIRLMVFFYRRPLIRTKEYKVELCGRLLRNTMEGLTASCYTTLRNTQTFPTSLIKLLSRIKVTVYCLKTQYKKGAIN